jgi:hypothetical protein
MDELQKLDGELNVPDPAWSKLDVIRFMTLRATGGTQDMLFDAFLHSADASDVFGSHLVRENEGARLVHQLLSELEPTRAGSCLQQGLKLPRFGPSPVVLEERIQRSHECSGAPFWTEVGIDRIRLSLWGVAPKLAEE